MRSIRKHWKKMVLLSAFGIVLLIAAFVLTRDHWWRALGGVRVTYDGQVSAASRVYKSECGDLLIFVADEQEGRLYIFHHQSENIGMPSRSTFVLLPGFAYSKIVPPPAPLMQSVKIEVDPELVVQPQLVEFNSFETRRVRVTW